MHLYIIYKYDLHFLCLHKTVSQITLPEYISFSVYTFLLGVMCATLYSALIFVFNCIHSSTFPNSNFIWLHNPLLLIEFCLPFYYVHLLVCLTKS